MNDLIGIPYVYGGRDPTLGLDCVGLLEVVLHRLGIPFSPPALDVQHAKEILRAIEQQQRSPVWQEVAPTEIQTGDVALLGRHHVGVLIDGGVIHTCKRFGVCIQSPIMLQLSCYPSTRWYRYCG